MPLRVDDMFLLGLKRNTQTLENASRFGMPNQIVVVFPKSVNANPRAAELYPAIEAYVRQHLAEKQLVMQSQNPHPDPVWNFWA